jgi:thiazole synthase ThiGH ThiG subunit
MNFAGKFLLPFTASVLTIMSISYSACHESKADGANDSATALVNGDFRKYELKIDELIKLHESQVKLLTNDVGMTSNSEALEMIQKHKSVIEKHQSRLDYHRLQLLHGDTADTAKANKMLNELKSDLELIAKDMEAVKADAESEASLNIRQ